MAFLWLVVVMVFSRNVFARDCSNIGDIGNCDECTRCGGHWCNDPYETTRCVFDPPENWCKESLEDMPVEIGMKETGRFFNPKYVVSSVRIGRQHKLSIDYQTEKNFPKVDFVVNSTQTSDFLVENVTSCESNLCTTTVYVSPATNFCSAKGQKFEYFNVKLSVENITEESLMKFHVPCACQCSEKVEEASPKCNGRGKFSCGVCACDKGWSGKFCETPICEKKRGDVPCTDSRSDVECSGNGFCGSCDECVCFTNKTGSQYFDQDNFCADICMTINDCDTCIIEPALGRCDSCHFPLIRQPLNKTLLAQKDSANRNIWVPCNYTFGSCNYEYVAMKTNDETFLMFTNTCDPTEEKQVVGGVNVTLPIVLVVIGVIAAAAATAGYIMWKNRPPALPLNDPMYQNIGAEDCTGENPLYKPPTSSFKNPTYGKW